MQLNSFLLSNKNLRFRIVILALGLALGLALSLSGAQAAPSGAERDTCDTRLTILSITDLHGALLSEDKDFATGKPVGGAAVVGAYIEAERDSSTGPVLVLASGDMMQGSAISNLSMGEAVIEFMNRLGFEACAVGNHEFDWGVDVLKERIKQAKFPFLVANIFSGSGSKRPNWAVPYTVVQKGNLKIGIIGVITEDAPVVINPKSIEGLRFDRPDSLVNKLAAQLRHEGVNVIIVLAHTGGTQEENGTVTGPIAGFASKLEGVDAVLGGHSHTVVSGTVNSIPVVIAGANGVRLGIVRLRVDVCEGGSSLLEETVKPTFAEDVEPDQAVACMIESYREKLASQLDRVVAIASGPIVRGRQESALGDLVCDIMRSAVGAAVAYQNSGGVRADLDEGPITGGEIYRIMPFDNTIVTMYLTGAQVKEALEQGTTERGVVQVSGIHYTYKPGNPSGQRIQSVTLEDGKPISPKKLYLVATNDFMANGGDRFTVFKAGKKIRNTQLLVRDAVISWMEARNKAGEKIASPKLGRAEMVQ
ncbi:MAG: 5'-nucleotidase C-terminal domain-containing protein [Candidatus Eisenbacteria bacterium]|nr:5'-nucleotidase C-terminal domain-containing protein [Candidatus Eisenbacteria bacterium]